MSALRDDLAQRLQQAIPDAVDTAAGASRAPGHLPLAAARHGERSRPGAARRGRRVRLCGGGLRQRGGRTQPGASRHGRAQGGRPFQHSPDPGPEDHRKPRWTWRSRPCRPPWPGFGSTDGAGPGCHVRRRRLFGGRGPFGRGWPRGGGYHHEAWGGASDTGCCSVADVDDARRVAHQLGIDHYVFNFSEEFDRRVVEPYVADHAAGRTPNPCVECNRHLKFDRLLVRANQLGFDAVATGHHARVRAEPGGRVVPATRSRPGQGPVVRAAHAGPGPAGSDSPSDR